MVMRALENLQLFIHFSISQYHPPTEKYINLLNY